MKLDRLPERQAELVAFEHPAPDYRSEYSRIFEGTERFDQPFTGIVFDRELLGAAQLHRDAEFRDVIESQAERRLSRLTRSTTYTDRVRQYLVDR